MSALVTAVWAAVRLRRQAMPALIAGIERPPSRSRREHAGPRDRRKRRNGRPGRRRTPVTPIVAVLRLFAGFAAPMRENAVVVAALRRCGVPAQLVVGADPVPDQHGGYRVYTWIEIAGVPLDADSPPSNYLVEMARFPKIGQGGRG